LLTHNTNSDAEEKEGRAPLLVGDEEKKRSYVLLLERRCRPRKKRDLSGGVAPDPEDITKTSNQNRGAAYCGLRKKEGTASERDRRNHRLPKGDAADCVPWRGEYKAPTPATRGKRPGT